MEQASQTEALSSSTFREASFPQAFLGYEKRAVHEFLNRIADWVDERSPEGQPPSQITSEFAKVGERTSGILTAAEEAASKLRTDAKEYAEALRAKAEEETRRASVTASQKADEIVAHAEGRADQIMEEAVARRRRLNQAVAALLERRDEIADEAQRLAEELLGSVEGLRSEQPPADPENGNGGAPEAEAAPDNGHALQPEGEPTRLEPADERETAVHDTRQHRP